MRAISALGSQPPGHGASRHAGLSGERSVGWSAPMSANSLAPVASEIDVATFMQALRTTLQGRHAAAFRGKEATAVRTAFTARINAKMQAQAAQLGSRNPGRRQRAFWPRTRPWPACTSRLRDYGTWCCAGLGPAARCRPTAMRVNYRGALLDGTVFDGSTIAAGRPDSASAGDPGWTEGVGLMPVGSKVPLLDPASRAAAPRARPAVRSANATLTFDVGRWRSCRRADPLDSFFPSARRRPRPPGDPMKSSPVPSSPCRCWPCSPPPVAARPTKPRRRCAAEQDRCGRRQGATRSPACRPRTRSASHDRHTNGKPLVLAKGRRRCRQSSPRRSRPRCPAASRC